MFVAALGALGGRAHGVGRGAAAADVIETIVREHSDTAAVLYEPCGLIDELGLHLGLRARGVELLSVADAGQRATQLGVGLTCAQVAIAESGTLLVGGDAGGWGLAAALPRVHIALLRPSAIEPDLTAAFTRFRHAFADGQRNWVWVSGPSKTADIAMQMVTGVHGPNALDVLIVDEDTGASG